MKEVPPFLSDEEHLDWLGTQDHVLARRRTPVSLEISEDGILAQYNDGFGRQVVIFTPNTVNEGSRRFVQTG